MFCWLSKNINNAVYGTVNRQKLHKKTQIGQLFPQVNCNHCVEFSRKISKTFTNIEIHTDRLGISTKYSICVSASAL